MRYLTYLLLPALFLFSCKPQEEEQLNPNASKKILLLQVDYDDYKFNSGKEFSYFKDANPGSTLPVTTNTVVNPTDKRLTMLYGDNKDTIFDGLEILNGVGHRSYPDLMDDQIFYYRIEQTVAKPANTAFETFYYELSDPIPYDSIWKGISDLQLVQQYRSKNPGSSIGIFLFRPSKGSSSSDWKWFVLMRD